MKLSLRHQDKNRENKNSKILVLIETSQRLEIRETFQIQSLRKMKMSLVLLNQMIQVILEIQVSIQKALLLISNLLKRIKTRF